MKGSKEAMEKASDVMSELIKLKAQRAELVRRHAQEMDGLDRQINFTETRLFSLISIATAQ